MTGADASIAYQRYRRFEDLCAAILADAGFEVEREVETSRRGTRIDIVATPTDDEPRFIEVKYSSLPSVSLGQLRDWAARVAGTYGDEDLPRPVLIVSGKANPARRDWAEAEYDVEIWDRPRLREMATPKRLEELETFFAEHDRTLGRTVSTMRTLEMLDAPEPEPTASPVPETPRTPEGPKLLKRLEDLAPGKGAAGDYEFLCQEIIQYLFGDWLLDPRRQHRIEDGLNILDIVYRVDPRHHFWATLTRDFRARVVVFECKNYTDPITPMQVFTTERYMSVNALRPLCFMLTRKAPHAHAELAAFGALRESGKLLIMLNDEDLVQMIKVRDAQLLEEPGTPAWDQNDPTIILDQKIYDFVARCPR